MFQFTPSPSCMLCIHIQVIRHLPWLGFPIRTSAGLRIFAPYRSLSQLIASFFGYRCQGIHPALLVTWPIYGSLSSISWHFDEVPSKNLLLLAYPLCTLIFCKTLLLNFYFSLSFLSFGLFSSFLMQFSRCIMPSLRTLARLAISGLSVVGSRGLEPPTLRLSGVRSKPPELWARTGFQGLALKIEQWFDFKT